MKVLYRGERELKWHDASWDGINYYIENRATPETNIVAISDLKSEMFVKCSHCNAIIRNTPSAIEKHKQNGKDSNVCFTCRNMRKAKRESFETKYALCEDGNYILTYKDKCQLYCTLTYDYPDINSERARNVCKYKGCIDAEYPILENFFNTYPEAFDDMITVDKIIENGYRERHSYNDYDLYELKARNTILAVVNKQNIVTRFSVTYRNYHNDRIVYSPKYNKLFDARGNIYIEWKPSIYEVPSDTQERIKQKIASLYN